MNPRAQFSRPATLLAAALVLAGCASNEPVLPGYQNQPTTDPLNCDSYSLTRDAQVRRDGDFSLVLTFSGGGHRAAALAYGVMLGLKEVSLTTSQGEQESVLDEVDMISSVSGGSFPAAYYGLYRDRIFSDFEDDFLRADVSRSLVKRLLDPNALFGDRRRTDHIVSYFEETLFRNKTFGDLKQAGGPLIVINATDLGRGVRFSFLQEYFDLLCSDIDSYPISRAVTASAAVPLVFNPVVVRNFGNCRPTCQSMELLQQAQYDHDSMQVRELARDLESYEDAQQRPFIHLIDGGITDNLGLMAIYEMVEITGGATEFLRRLDATAMPHYAVISVDASTNAPTVIEQSTQPPTVKDTINAVTEVQLHRYNAATIDLMGDRLERWTGELADQGIDVTPHFVRIRFSDLPEAERRYFDSIPTGLSLTDIQVTTLINTGRSLLFNNPDFQRLAQAVGARIPDIPEPAAGVSSLQPPPAAGEDR
ncbi:patatin-like phospholipase family protein [Microbulbifer sp. JSM ZJ756]|uniref:patatin-like phospholipase family protein n=1 Tax=Microbulbifer sp. JSM ZJ756 TaxID=3376191 RepID=UPI00379FA731